MGLGELLIQVFNEAGLLRSVREFAWQLRSKGQRSQVEGKLYLYKLPWIL